MMECRKEWLLVSRMVWLGFALSVGIVSVHAAPPTPPNSIRALINSNGYVELYWSRASDDGAVVGYELIKNGVTIQVGNVTEYFDSDVVSRTTYTYRVVAVDNDGERSASNNKVTVTMSGSGFASAASSISVSSSTPAISASPVCVDTDGDGWGWDGSQSCMVHQNVSPAVVAECVDPDGDGWGWNGMESCEIQANEVTGDSGSACVDSDGDGWGWNGTESCIP